ncbi:hypothetical protein AM1BK_25320 [Neobacillus kokaensis]|uniref:Uncharacterized protein n=1 Tax=Neobacillus kokaensis TaxID=2759023 RepID=A0ABQ3N4A9_9BACI|nr:hypothetical protein AM1BK_25320 [Neobacillus kokaensis]
MRSSLSPSYQTPLVELLKYSFVNYCYKDNILFTKEEVIFQNKMKIFFFTYVLITKWLKKSN